MAEQEQHIHKDFDAQAMGDLLGTPSAPTSDVAYGQGWRISTERDVTQLEVFPRVTRIVTDGTRIELFDHVLDEASPTGIETHRENPHQEASLTRLPNGGAVFTLIVEGEEHTPAGRGQPVEPDAPQLAASGNTSTPPETSTEFIARDIKHHEELAAAQTLLGCPPDYLTRIGVTEQAITEAQALVEAEEPPTARQDTPDDRPPARAPEEPREPTAAPTSRAPRRARQGSRSHPAASGRVDTSGSTEGREKPIPEIIGRIGNTRPDDPSHETFSFYTTQKGTVVGAFHLIVDHADRAESTWHRIQVYGDHARSLQQRVKDGELKQNSPVTAYGCYPKIWQKPNGEKMKYVNAAGGVSSAPQPPVRGLAGKPS
jgi:hypothetical protein